jgi:D-galactonate transporter
MENDNAQHGSKERDEKHAGLLISPDTESAVYRKITRRLLPLLLASYILAYLDRVNVSFAKLQMAVDLGFSDFIYGTGAGLFYVGYFLFEVPSNIILHHVGARVWIARIMITWGIISASMMFITDVNSFYVLRFLLGIAEAGFFPGIILYLTYWYPAQRRARIISLFMLGIPMAGMLGGPLSGWIMRDFDQLLDLRGWQWMFLIEALPSVVMGLILLRFLDNGIQDAKWLSDDERLLLQKNIAQDESVKEKVPVLQVLKSPRVWILSLIYFTVGMGLSAIVLWLPTIIKGMGVTDVFEVGLLAAIPWCATFIPVILVSRHADKKGERRWHFIIPLLFVAAGLTCSALFASNHLLVFLALTVSCSAVMTAYPLFWSLPTAFLAGTGAAAGIAVINSIGGLSGFVSPYLLGWIKQTTGSLHIGMYLVSACLIAGALTTLIIPAKLVNR